MKLLRVVMIAAEAAPFAKVGGLADVLGALPQQLEKRGVSVSVIIPRYRAIDLQRFGFELLSLPPEVTFDVQTTLVPNSGVRVFLIGNDHFFGRDGIYLEKDTGTDYADQADRWIFFQQAAMEFVRLALSPVDILHCHDHQTGLIPAYLRRWYSTDPAFSRTRSVFTIHNLGYQGLFPASVMARTGFGEAAFHHGSPFEFYGNVNFMKTGIVYADRVTTVSTAYAHEISEIGEQSFGLDGVLRSLPDPVLGILNGIDSTEWNPATDPLIPAHFDAGSTEAMDRKAGNKLALLQDFELDPAKFDRPVFAMISRIDVQKGFDLVVEVLDELLARDACFVLLGMGHRDTELKLRDIAKRHPGRAGLRFAYENRLAHRIVAGADMFLMPSKYEPCGLTQMYSMRYGTVPVVRATGGLADTVQEFDRQAGTGNGFRFADYTPEAFLAAIDRALQLWTDSAAWQVMMRNGMTTDFSWTKSARQYVEAYENVMARTLE